MACLTRSDYVAWIDVLAGAGVQRCSPLANNRATKVALNGWIVKKDKQEPKKRRVYCVLNDSILDVYDTEAAATSAAAASAAADNNGTATNGTATTTHEGDRRPPQSFDLWLAVVTLTPESHKRVFAVYPEGEQQPFLLQCRDAANFKEWFTAVGDAAGANAAPVEDSSATRVFGAPLHTVMNRQGRRPPIPLVMAATVEYLESYAFRESRLFFVQPTDASQRLADSLVEQYDSGIDVRLSKITDPIAVILLFRRYLELLPEPLLTFERHAAFMNWYDFCFVCV